jgi:putative transposase
VLCVNEKSQIQALERSQPALPMGLGYVEGVTADYFCRGTSAHFAALDITKGGVIGQCRPRHRHQGFLSFLNHLDRNVLRHLDVHLILDDYATHEHARVRAWFAKRPRYHLHFTPMYSLWLNQVEHWLGLITQRAIRHGSLRSVRELIHNIGQFIDRNIQDPRPFKWTASANTFFEKLTRFSKVISETVH